MNAQSASLPNLPLGVLRSLWRATEIVSSRPSLLLIPVGLDLLLWLGPHLSVHPVTGPLLDFLGQTQSAAPVTPADAAQALKVLSDAAQHINLVALLGLFPLFPPTLMATRLPLLTPWGPAPVFVGGNLLVYPAAALALALGGVMLGSGYWAWVGRTVASPAATRGRPLQDWLRVSRSVLVLSVGLTVLALAIGLPIVFGVGLVGMASALLGQILIVLFAGLVLWVLVFFAFSIHGLVLQSDPLLRAMKKSAEVVRWSYPSSLSLMLLTALALMAASAVWALPAEDSWATLLGVVGNAYTSTVLVAGSLVYYQDRRRWVEEMRGYLEARSRRLVAGGSGGTGEGPNG